MHWNIPVVSDSTGVVPERRTGPPLVEGGAGEHEGEQGVPELEHQRSKKKSMFLLVLKGRKTLAGPFGGNQLILKIGK